METTFYEDARYSRGGLKRPATLDLNAVRSSKKPRGGALLTSPDLHMLKLESPELEKLIIQQHGLAGGGQCMYPRDEARDHQSCYPRDFPDALGGLQQQQPPPVNNFNLYQQPLQSDISLGNGMGLGMDYGYHPHPPQQAQQPSLDGHCNVVSSNGYPAPPPPVSYYSVEPMVSIKEEPQTVPCASPPDNPPRSPIDMEDQEKMKLERKRLRNRIAASKCRRRKLERIARLEDKVSHLKGENVELQGHVTRLKEHVCRLKQQVLDHVRSGCDILISHPAYAEDL